MCGSLNCSEQDSWTGDCKYPLGKEPCGEIEGENNNAENKHKHSGGQITKLSSKL